MQLLIGGLTTAILTLATMAERPSPDNPPKPADPAKLAGMIEGGYTIASGEEEGKAIPAERLKGAVVRITDGKIVGTDKDRKEFFAATYKLDTTKKPWKIDMKSIEPKEAATTGLVKKEGDTLTIIYALPGGDAPTEFKTKAKQQMFVLKSFAADPKEPNKFRDSP
jgi:uncharacterized protein (TIGR03067 family)